MPNNQIGWSVSKIDHVVEQLSSSATHCKLADVEEVVNGVVPHGEEHSRELAGGGDEQRGDNELAAVADDFELLVDVV
jgi:hypothetical protein